MIRDVLVRHCNHKSSLHSELTFSKSHDQHFSIKRAIISARKKDKNKNCTLYTKDIMYKLHRNQQMNHTDFNQPEGIERFRKQMEKKQQAYLGTTLRYNNSRC